MAKKSANEQIENTEQTEQTIESVSDVKVKRQRRIKTSSVIPSEATSWQGSVTVEVLEGNSVTFEYSTPEVSDLLAKAIDAGFKARFTTVVAGETEPTKINSILEAELKELQQGKFGVKTPKDSTVEFNNSVVALAMTGKIENLSGVTFENVEATLSDIEALVAAKTKWDETEDKKSFETTLFNVCRSIVGTFRKVQEASKPVKEEVSE